MEGKTFTDAPSLVDQRRKQRTESYPYSHIHKRILRCPCIEQLLSSQIKML